MVSLEHLVHCAEKLRKQVVLRTASTKTPHMRYDKRREEIEKSISGKLRQILTKRHQGRLTETYDIIASQKAHSNLRKATASGRAKIVSNAELRGNSFSMRLKEMDVSNGAQTQEATLPLFTLSKKSGSSTSERKKSHCLCSSPCMRNCRMNSLKSSALGR